MRSLLKVNSTKIHDRVYLNFILALYDTYMQKDFDTWNIAKKKLDSEPQRFYTVREIWWCKLGLNIGTEQNGNNETYTRPCIILRGFGPHACLVVPLTKSARNHQFRIPVGKIANIDAKANLSQIKTVDTKRLVEKIGFLNKAVFSKIQKIAKAML